MTYAACSSSAEALCLVLVLLAVHRRCRVQRIHLEGLLGLSRNGLSGWLGGGFHLVKWGFERDFGERGGEVSDHRIPDGLSSGIIFRSQGCQAK